MKKKLFIAALLATTSTNVYAQTAGGVGATVALPEVVIDENTPFNPYAGAYNGPIAKTTNITGTKKPIIEVPRSVYVVTPQTLQQQMPQSLAEALQTVPGTFMGNTNGGNSDYITIKGFEVDSQDFVALGNGDGILIDGIKSPFDRAFNANTQSVSLLSGPASLLYGNGNVGGIIDIQRKLPLPEAHYAADILGSAVSQKGFRGAAGSFDFTGPLYKSTEGVLAYRLVGSGAGVNPWRNGDTVTRDFLMAPTLAFYSTNLTATLAYEHDRNQQPYDRGVTATGPRVNPATGTFTGTGTALYSPTGPLQISRYTSYSEPYSQYNENLNWVHSEINWHANKDTDFRLRTSYAATDLLINEVRSDNQTDFFPNGRPAAVVNGIPNPALPPGSILRYQQVTPQGVNTQQYFVQGTATRRFDLGPIHNEAIAGVDYYNFGQKEPNALYVYYGSNQPFNLYNPMYGGAPPNDYGSGRGLINYQNNLPYRGLPIEEQRQRDLGFFVQDAATWGPWTLTGGVRHTSIFSYIRNLSLSPTSNSTENQFLPSGQLLYLINKDTSLYASYSTSYQANLYGGPGLATNTVFVGPNNPQSGQGYETGIKSAFFDGRVLAQASSFLINKQNVQTISVIPPATTAYSFLQSQRSEGAQLSVIGYITPNLEINVNYSHQNVFVYADGITPANVGRRVPNAPANTYAAYAYYHFLDGWLNHLTVNAGFFGATANAVDSANTFALPGYTIFSTGFSYSYQKTPTTPKYVLSFKMNNIADKAYYPSSGSKTNWITVGEPRNFLIDLSVGL